MSYHQNPYPNPNSTPHPYPTQGATALGFGFNASPHPPQGAGQYPYPAAGAPPGHPPQNLQPQAGFQSPSYQSQGHLPQGYPPKGYPTQGYPHQQGYPPQQGYNPPHQGFQSPSYQPAMGHPPQGTQGYPPQGTQGYPPPAVQSYPQQGYAPPPVATPYPSAGAPAAYAQQQYAVGGAPAQVQAYAVRKVMPTVRPKMPFGPAEEEADAAALRKAMKGFGTDEKAIIAILANRSNQQRQQIARRFTALYGKDLVKDLKSELGGKFEDTVVACMTPLDQYFAKELHGAMAGLGTNEDALIEILCTLNNAWIHAIKNSYQQQYKKSLESDIKGDTSGCFERLLISLCQGMRDENPVVNPTQVTNDVMALFQAGQNKIGTDESTFNAILSTRSLPHLREVFQQYHRTHGVSFEKVIHNEFSGSIKTSMLAIVKCMSDCSAYFAERLHDSMAGAGTNDKALIRTIVSRSECDLGDIKVAFQKKYNKTLESFIEGDCSGDYKKMLIALVTAS